MDNVLTLPSKQQWDDQQREAITRCVDIKERIVPVTGRAGTGKTSIIKEVYTQLTSAGYKVGISAPTGKAAKRIQELTGISAETNHRLLGYGMPIEQDVTDVAGKKERVRLSTGPKFNKRNPLYYDVILCDEYAMVNHEIHRNIIDALKVGGRIRTFGDVNQLRPIEEDKRLLTEPSPFERTLRRFNGIELTTLHRQEEGSGISRNAARILAGRQPTNTDDFKVVWSQTPVVTLEKVIREASERGIDYSTTDHQIITCMNVSWVGTIKLNARLQAMFWNREHQGMTLPRWRDDNNPVSIQIGSKVVYTQNNYDLGNNFYALNGETGIVVDIDHFYGSVTIDFMDRTVIVPPLVVTETSKGMREFDPRCNINLAYALTTHKMQGSECRHAIYIMNKSSVYNLSRRNFYTGVTRAREHCTVISDTYAMGKATKHAG